ncbi:hypothetical protein BDR06DRAFT_952101 [Suillus hirtellus]|nr:hypothetical protein BDR06DRAFT_952101 [Suillus hirtellus]
MFAQTCACQSKFLVFDPPSNVNCNVLYRIHKVLANDAKETQLTIAPTHSNVQREVSLKIGLPSENVRDKDTSRCHPR